MPNVEEQICFFLFFLLCLWFWYCPDNCRLFMMYDRGTSFLNALWFSIDFLSTFRSSTSRVTNYSNCDNIWERNKTLVICFHDEKKKHLTQWNAWQKRMHMVHTVYLHRHDMLTVPLTVLLHSPITSIIITITISSNVIGELAALYFTNHSVQLKSDSWL